MSILSDIVETKKEEVRRIKQRYSLASFEEFELFEQERRNFKNAISISETVNVIAEIKKASPSKGVIREDFNHLRIFDQYQEAGAAAVSILTDEHYFQGDLRYLAECRKEAAIPLLRKDFIVDPIQVFEAKAHGADAILLIATILSATQLDDLWSCAHELGMASLVELYNPSESEKVNLKKVDIIGVNNRDLNSFKVDVHRGVDILASFPESVVTVSESGLESVDDLILLRKNSINAALIGETFMKQPHPGDALKRLLEQLNERV